MNKIIQPKVKSLADGEDLIVKQMQAKAGELLPKHLANKESILFVHEGKCILNINDENKILEKGDAFIIPQDIKHQIKVETDFKGIHFMPKSIEFQFFN